MLISPMFIFYFFVCFVFILADEKVYAIVKLVFLGILFLIKNIFKRRELKSINERGKIKIDVTVIRLNKEGIL